VLGVYLFARALNTAGSPAAFAAPALPAALTGRTAAATITHES